MTAVGDPCQAIYGWRGASVGNIDAFPVDFPRADGEPGAALRPRRRTTAAAACCSSSPTRCPPTCARATPGSSSWCRARVSRPTGRTVVGLFERQADEVDWVAD